MEAALQPLLARILGDTSFAVHVHQGKQDLLGRLESRLRGYARWLPADWRVIVLVDRDNDNCEKLRGKLEDISLSSGLTTRKTRSGEDYTVVTRLAIEELEAWVLRGLERRTKSLSKGVQDHS